VVSDAGRRIGSAGGGRETLQPAAGAPEQTWSRRCGVFPDVEERSAQQTMSAKKGITMHIVTLVIGVFGMGCILLGGAIPFEVVRRFAVDHAIVEAVRHGTQGLPRGLKARLARVAPFALLEQVLLLCGALCLLATAVLAGNRLYMVLELLLIASTLLYFCDEVPEETKGKLGLLCAIGLGAGLLYTGEVAGFKLTGLLGLESLGCGYLLQQSLPRQIAIALGGFLLMLNSLLGMCWDVPEQLWMHLLWFHLNFIFTGLVGLSLARTLGASVGARCVRNVTPI
jgi:hypothetical protein